jgi:hypothetical protein
MSTGDKISVRLVGGPMDLDDTTIEVTYITIRKTVVADDGTCHNYLIEQDIDGNWKGTYHAYPVSTQ